MTVDAQHYHGVKRMNFRRTIGAAMLAATVPVVSAQEIGGGRLVWELVSEGIKQQLVPREITVPAPGVQPDLRACEVLQWEPDMPGKPALVIRHPGKYCLQQGHVSECPPAARDCGGYLIEIRASNVDLDLRGNILRVSGTRDRGGIWGSGRGIRIHNGHIAGGGVGVTLVDGGSSPLPDDAARPASPADASSGTGFVVEQMRFTDVRTAIEVAGSGNRIRDNRIDAARD
jgi:hypothetical protein